MYLICLALYVTLTALCGFSWSIYSLVRVRVTERERERERENAGEIEVECFEV
jgi:hypothetical protein